MRLIIIGSGYVGLVSGASFAELGNEVLCVDTDAGKIARLQAGQMPIFEPNLRETVARNVDAGRLRFADQLPAFGAEVDAVFIAVGTPALANGQGADLSFVYAAASDIAAKADGKVLVVTKSTVPVGTGDAVEQLMREARLDLHVTVAANPEFLREGCAIVDFMAPDRIVVGTDSADARQTLVRLYQPLTRLGAPIAHTGRRAAELIKYAANAFLAIKIAYVNEMADLCEATGADIDQVALGVGLDHRIGGAFLEAGPGYGGSCFPKDSAALLATAQEHAVNLRLVESTISANEARKRAIGRRIIGALGGTVSGKTVGVLGLTFKPNTDDMRDAPSVAMIASLRRSGATVRVYDPQGMEQARRALPGVVFTANAYDCAAGTDCIVLATAWQEFSALDARHLAGVVRTRVIVDLRNGLDGAKFSAAGFTVHAIGHQVHYPTSRPAIVTLRRRDPRNVLPFGRPNGGQHPPTQEVQDAAPR